MTKNTGGPAFPVPDIDGGAVQEGMTLRDYFAAKSMQAILSYGYPITLDPDAENKISVAAYQQADAMLKAREA